MNKVESDQIPSEQLSIRKVLVTWLPLVASWTLMSLEIPVVNAIIARLSNPEINLAAYGGFVYPIALTIEAPIIMLLAGSTALSRDWQSYRRLRKITIWMGGGLSLLHLVIALTPLFDFIANVILRVPSALVEPGRSAFLMLTPWTFSIAFRRFQQGAMIRFGHSRAVGETTFIRLITVLIVLAVGITTKALPGAVLAGLAQGLGVTSEAIFAGIRIRKIIPEMKTAPEPEKQLTIQRFIVFYTPLALTSTLWLLWQPIMSGSLSRMPDPIESLAIWSVVTGLLFMFRSPGVAFNEAVVALLEEPKSFTVLKKFARIGSLVSIGIAILFVVTPLSNLWFTYGANIQASNVPIARYTMILGLPLAFLPFYISFYQGIIVDREKTGPVAEAVAVFLATISILLIIGVITNIAKGVYVAAVAYSAAHLTQTLWLMIRSRKQRRLLAGV
ncbi:MAG: hypothetical protein SCH68_08455 [Brevefilum sp.]|nr:hypothetical protein [Brevefilum sp.]